MSKAEKEIQAFRYIRDECEPIPRNIRQGAASTAGMMFEVGIATVLFIRGMFETTYFSLNSNVEGYGAFDDLVFRYKGKNSNEECTSFLQLKHKEIKENKEEKTITLEALRAKSGDFSLVHYFDSFCQIKKEQNGCISKNDNFIVYTNISMKQGTKHTSEVNTALGDFFNTGNHGQIISIKIEALESIGFKHLEDYKKALQAIISCDDISEKEITETLKPYSGIDHCKRVFKDANKKTSSPDKDKKQEIISLLQQQVNEELEEDVWKNFIDRLKIFTRQASVNDLDNKIKKLLKQYLGTDKMSDKLTTAMTKWKEDEKYILTSDYAPFWFSILDDHIGELTAPMTKKLSALSKLEFSVTEDFPGRVVHILTKGCTEISCRQIQQHLSNVNNMMIDSDTLISRFDEILAIWKYGSWCRVLVVNGNVTGNILEKVEEMIQHSQDKKIIFVSQGSDEYNSKLNRLSETEIYKESFLFNHLHENSQYMIMNCKFEFQGALITMKDFAENNSIEEIVDADFVFQLLTNPDKQKVGERVPDEVSYHIRRTLYRKEYISKDIISDKTNLRLAVSNISLNDLQCLVPLGEKVDMVDRDYQFKIKSCRYFVIKKDEQFKLLCKLYDNIHLISVVDDNKCRWLNSHGPLTPIINYIKQNEIYYESYSEDNEKFNTFINYDNKFAIILGEPGMGKTMELDYWAWLIKKLDPDKWVVRVKLIDCTEYLANSKSNLSELLLKTGNLKSEFERKLFEYKLRFGNTVEVFFDGLDEINTTKTNIMISDKVIDMLKNLSKTSIRKIWLTSRQIMKDKLQNEFPSLPYGLCPLTKEEQVKYLINSWKLPESKEKLVKEFIYKLLTMINGPIKDTLMKFTGIPLHTKMLAELFLEQATEYTKNLQLKLPIGMNFYNLYSEFMNMKWNEYCKKNNLVTTNPAIDTMLESTKYLSQQDLKYCSLVTVLDNDIDFLKNKEDILLKYEHVFAKLKAGIEIPGLVVYTQDKTTIFVHKSFAEYFAAISFAENYQKQEYFKEMYISRKYEMVRQVFDRILSGESHLHVGILNYDIGEVRTLLSRGNCEVNKTDSGGRTALHLAIVNFLNMNVDDSNNLTRLLYEIIELLLENHANISKVDKVLSWSPLRLAEEVRAWNVVDLLLQHRADPKDLVLIRQNIEDRKFVRDLLEASASKGFVNIVSLMLNYGESLEYCFPFKESLLHVAASYGQLSLVKFLIEKNADLNVYSEFGENALTYAVTNRNEDVAMILLNHGADPYSKDIYGNSVLHYATRGNLESILEWILESNCNVDNNNNEGETPLMCAINHSNVIMAMKLIEYGADINAEDNCGNSALHYAARSDLSVVKKLLEYKCDVDCSNHKGETPLMSAIIDGKYEVAKYLLDYRANPDCKDKHGDSPLHYAVVREYTGILKLLLKQECEVDNSNNDGETPLMCAVRNRFQTIAILLLDRRSNPHVKDKRGNSVIHYAAEYNFCDLVEKLLELKCDINISNDNGETPLMCAVINMKDNNAMTLLHSKANPHPIDKFGNSIMHYVAETNFMALMDKLLELECRTNISNNNGQTPLMLSVINRQEHMALKLLRNGANPDVSDKYGNSVIHYAAATTPKLLDELLSISNKSVDKSNNNGETPLIYAIINCYEEVALKLLQYEVNSQVKDNLGNSALHYASGKNMYKIVDELLDRNCDIDNCNSNGQTPLIFSVIQGNEQMALKLLQRKAKSDIKDKYGNKVMHYATEKNFPRLEELLLEFENHATNDDDNNNYGETPLMLAVINNNMKLARKLLYKGANPDVTDQHGNSVIHYAVFRNVPDLVDCLLKYKCNVNSSNNDGETPLHYAAKNNLQELTMKLLNNGANPSAKDKDGNSVMHYAAEDNHPFLVEKLLKFKCDINEINNNGETPLMLAVMNSNEEMAIKLLDHGANFYVKDKEGNSIMHYAVFRNLPELVKRLLQSKCDIDSINNNGETPLMLAVVNSNEELALKLLYHEASPNVRDKYSNSVMHYAAEKNLPKLVDRLLEYNCTHIHDSNYNGESPLMSAVINGKEEMAIKLLRHHKAKSDIKDKYGNSIMHYAAGTNLPGLLEYLLDERPECDVNSTNNNGETPLMCAVISSNETIAKTLLRRGASPVPKDESGCSVLHYAAVTNQAGLIELIFSELFVPECRPNINDVNGSGETPLMCAVINCNEQMVIKLLDIEADPKIKDKQGNSIMHYASGNNLMKWLLNSKMESKDE